MSQMNLEIISPSVYKEEMDQWLLVVTSDPAAKGSAKDLEVASAAPVHCHFPFPPSFLTMGSSDIIFIHVTMVHRPS